MAVYRVHKKNYSKNIRIYLNEMLSWIKDNQKKLESKNMSLKNIKFDVFKLKIKLLIKNILSLF